MDTRTLNYDFGLDNEHVRENADGSLTVSGYASNYDEDRVGDTVTREALTEALDGYSKNPTVLFNHKFDLPAGRVTKARVDHAGLWIEANLPKPSPSAPQLVRFYWEAVKNGTMRAFSIGGAWTRDAARRLIKIDLREISIAAAGVNATTLMSSQVGKAFGDPVDPWGDRIAMAEIERSLREVRELRSINRRAQIDRFLRS